MSAGVPSIPSRERKDRAKRAPGLAPATLARLAQQHPNAHCELDHRSPYQLIVAVVLSAQTTDVAVNKVTPKLFADYPDARALAAAEPEAIEPYVASLGFFRMKSKAIVGLARALADKYGGEVPRTLDELVKLPGVGRKTANVVLGVLWNTPEGVVVDTHVMRLSQRLGWSKNTEPEKIERDLCAILPKSEWDHASHVLIFHGRRCCFARKPDCPSCSVNDVCPAAFDAESVGRKARRGAQPLVVKLRETKARRGAQPLVKLRETKARRGAAAANERGAAKPAKPATKTSSTKSASAGKPGKGTVKASRGTPPPKRATRG